MNIGDIKLSDVLNRLEFDIRINRAVDEFFLASQLMQEALSYDDVTFVPRFTNVYPKDVDVSSRFSRNVPLKIPIVSAAMDRVTRYKMGIAMAKEGGLGIIDKSMSPEEQKEEIRRVKYHLNCPIEGPITVKESDTIEEILDRADERGWSFRSFPVVNEAGNLVGLLTGNDFDLCDDPSQKACDIMTTGLITADRTTTPDKAYRMMVDEGKKVIPVVDGGKIVAMYLLSDVKRTMTESYKAYNVDENGQLRVGAAIGDGLDALDRLEVILKAHPDVIVIDTAHASTTNAVRTLREIKAKYPDLDVVVGNISSAVQAAELVKYDPDGIKVGQGPGSICTTRKITGGGIPQVTAIYEVYEVARAKGIPVIADGGIKYSGDIAKAIIAGAHSVMVGMMLAGSEEAPGEIVLSGSRQMKDYRGMGSLAAMRESRQARARYQQGEVADEKLVPEGVEALVPYTGPIANTIVQLVGGLRSGMGMAGAANLEQLRDQVTFRKMTGAGHLESHVHDVKVVNDPPNYHKPGSS
ncbi:IMP dehydrogenase [Candidatus Woesearchaeota archaeon]|nr:IMP dehydrogenase [Candidatus Woesearchaeota archaeon]